MIKRFVCLLMVCLLSITCVFAEETAVDPDALVLAGLDINEYRNWGNNAFFTYMEEATGISFAFNQYRTEAAWEAAKAGFAAGGDMPDVLFKASLGKTESMEMLDKGILMDLRPYLEQYCPNLWAILQEKSEYMDAIALPDGRIPTLPYINDVPTQNVMWINKDFLTALDEDAPTTADELVAVLEAFRDEDPNGNGKYDEIPLGFLGSFDLKFLAHAFGLYCNDYNVFVEDGQVKFMPLEDNFRLFITWCRDLYEAGMLDEDGFVTSDTMRQVTDEDEDVRYGILIAPTVGSLLPSNQVASYELLMPLFYEGEQVYRDFAGDVITGAFALTTACRDIEKALTWVDYLYSEDGGRLLVMGKENVDYVVDADGTWRLTEASTSNAYFSTTTLITSGSTVPGIAVNDFQTMYSDAGLKNVTEALRAFNEYCVQPFPAYTLTREQAEWVGQRQAEIGYYVEMQIGRWVLGEEEISDETFAAFENKLYELGLNDFMAFWQDILNNL